MNTVHECDRQTDRQTDRITITDTVQRIESHGKNHAQVITQFWVRPIDVRRPSDAPVPLMK